jgi:hypothetical protein
MDGADELPSAHRSALLGAFGIGDDPGGDPFLVSLAALDPPVGARRPPAAARDRRRCRAHLSIDSHHFN